MFTKERQFNFSPANAFVYESNIWDFIMAPHRTRNVTLLATFSKHLLFLSLSEIYKMLRFQWLH